MPAVPSAPTAQVMVLLGRVLAPYGVKGWVKVEPFTESPETLRLFSEWRLGKGDPSDAWKAVKIAESAEHSGNIVARFDGCTDRDAALEYRGMGIAVAKNALPPVKPGEFYLADLVGLAVVNAQGEGLGQIASSFSNGAHEILRVELDGKERLLPFVPAIVQNVDVQAGVVRVEWQSDW